MECNIQMLPQQKRVFYGNQEHLQLWAVCLMEFEGSFLSFEEEKSVAREKKTHSNLGIIGCELSMT